MKAHVFTLLIAAVAAGCSQASFPTVEDSSPPTDSLTLGAGTMTAKDFGDPPAPAGFNPLTDDQISLTERNEVFIALPTEEPYNQGAGADPFPMFGREDSGSGHAEIPGSRSWGDFRIRAAASAQFDDDPELEIVAAGLAATGQLTIVYRGDRLPDDSYAWTVLQSVPTTFYWGTGFGVTDLAIDAGDLDGDGRDEIALAIDSSSYDNNWQRRNRTLVWEDPEEGGATMLDVPRTQEHAALYPVIADFHGDGHEDLVLVIEGDTTSHDRVAVSRYDGGEGLDVLTLSQSWFYVNTAMPMYDMSVVAGNFDSDPEAELAFAGLRRTASGTAYDRIKLNLVDVTSNGFEIVNPNNEWEVFNGWLSPTRDRGVAAVAVDRFGTGRDELALLVPDWDEFRLDFFDWDEDQVDWVRTDSELTGKAAVQSNAFQRATVAAADGDGDGAEEIYMGLMGGSPGASFTHDFAYGWRESGADGAMHWSPDETFTCFGRPRSPVIVPGDHDADGFKIKFTGRTTVTVGDPIPLVVLTAAPTKAGIGQNVGGSSTSYSVGTSVGESIGVTNGIGWSASLGFEASDLSDLFGFKAQATVSTALSETNTESTTTTYSQTFEGSPDDDVIVFQGTLFTQYHYRVLSHEDDPLDGTILTLDVPGESQLYKWTVDSFNGSVRPELQIGNDILPHSIGDPASYREAGEMDALLGSYVGWGTPSLPVGLGNGSTSQSISLETENVTESQLESTAEVGIEFITGGVTAGVSVSATSGSLYSVSTSEFTTYSGTIGDITDSQEYARWRYAYGLAVYQPGRTADGQNIPTGWESGARPLTVVTFWVDPQGSSY